MNIDKVLVIESDKGDRQAVKILLELNGITVSFTQEPELVLKHLDNDNIAVVLCSIEYAINTDCNLLALIKNHPRHYKVPVIILAAANADTDIRACFNAGADDYIIKPFTGKNLISTIKARLELNKKFQHHLKNEVNEEMFSLLNKNFNQELLTPLNGILNTTLLMEDLPGVPDVEGLHELLEAIYAAGFRMQRTTQNLRTYSLLNVENGYDTIKKNKEVSLQEVLKSVISNYENHLSSGNKKMDLQVIQDGTWEGPDELVKILFTELIDNAIKFSVYNTTPLVKLLALNNNFQFSVTSEVSEKVFLKSTDIGAFKKFHNDLSRNGLGLGLYICKCIAEKMGYQLIITATSNNVTFTVQNGAF